MRAVLSNSTTADSDSELKNGMKILVAVDSSSSYEVVLNEVASRPWPAGTSIEALTVVEPSSIWNVPRMENDPRETAETLANLAAKRLTDSKVQAYSLVKSGDPKVVIVEEAARIGADLVILGARGHSGVTRFLIGSVAHKVVAAAKCSVEIVRTRVREEPKVYQGTRIMLATDGSKSSENAAKSIAERPWLPGSEVNIVGVVEPNVTALHAPFLESDAMERARAEAMKHAQQAILSAEAIVTSAGLKATETVLVPLASTKELILHEAEKWGADLIVLGSHGRHGISRFLIGSVSEAVAAHAKCSVEVIRGAAG